MLIHFSFSQTHEPFIFLSLKIRTLVTEIWLEFKDVFKFDISEADLCRLMQPKNHKTSNISSGKQKVDTSIFWKRNPKEMKFTKPQTVSWYFVRRGLVQNFCLEFRIQTAWFLKTTKNAQKNLPISVWKWIEFQKSTYFTFVLSVATIWIEWWEKLYARF